MHFNYLRLFQIWCCDDRFQGHSIDLVLRKHVLYLGVVDVIALYAQNPKRLLFGNEAPAYPKALLSDFLATLVNKRLCLLPAALLI